MTEPDNQKEGYEFVNHPTHYNTGGIETIEKMIRIWGKPLVAEWCEITAFKYRERIGNKPEEPIERDMGKIRWYEEKAKQLRKEAKEEFERMPKGVVDEMTVLEHSYKKSIESFSKVMLKKLLLNKHKGGWEKMSIKFLQGRLNQELGEMERELSIGNSTPEKIIQECADVANFCMMLSENIKNVKMAESQ